METLEHNFDECSRKNSSKSDTPDLLRESLPDLLKVQYKIPIVMADGNKPEDLEVYDCWIKMQHGSPMTKLTGKAGERGRKPQKKKFILDDKRIAIYYEPTKKKHIRYEISQITDVQSGDDVKDVIGEQLAKKHPLNMCISIKFGDNNTTLDLIAPTECEANMWVYGLKTLMENKNNIKRDQALRQQWLIDAFVSFDKNKDGSLSLSEVTKLLNALNVNMTPKTIKKKFKEADSQAQDAALDKEEFAEFFKSIATREEIVEIMKTSPSRTHMNVRDLKEFLEREQGMKDVDKKLCDIIIDEFEPTEAGREAKELGIDGLTNFLLSEKGDIFNPTHDKLYQDMNQPLSHYFIASSHNTYLLEDQLRGPSSVDAYINALLKGCRCVELDCWDGDNGDPIVYHGHTFTSKIKFKDIIEAVNTHAFKVSEYPVILSLENHCNLENQKTIAAHLEAILGDKLYKEPVDTSLKALPSPESLKNKILIKGKKLKPEQEAEEHEEGDVSDEDEAGDIDPDLIKVSPDGGGEGSSSAAASKHEKESTCKERKKRPSGIRHSFRAVGRAVRKVKAPAAQKNSKDKAKVKLAKELSRCVNYISSVGFKNFEHSKANAKFYQMSSFAESKLTSFAEGKAAAFVDYNKRQLSRTYPAGNRVDSSNYNPQIGWNVGCQIVALNYQTDGEMMHINQGRFRQNKRTGYVLKPEFMRDESIKYDPKHPPTQRKTLKIKVISGQQLPKPAGQSVKGEVIDPYVDIKIYGVKSDQGHFKSKVVDDNGFNPRWDLHVEKDLHVPDVAMIRFTVFDQDVGVDDFIGQFSLPITNLLTGYRHIHLVNMKGEPIPNATLFVHVSLENTSQSKIDKENEHKQKKKRR